MPTITPTLWFDGHAEEAATFYCSVFPNSRITAASRYPAGSDSEGQALVVAFELDGQPVVGINGGPQFTFSEATSLSVDCADQAEIDRYWSALLEGGGQESMCGWLKDRFGFSWQVVPRDMGELMGGDDPEANARAYAAMLGMCKLDVAALRAAAEGVTAGA